MQAAILTIMIFVLLAIFQRRWFDDRVNDPFGGGGGRTR
jgi:hypothetical protein